jgi:hypothetical protein
MDNLFNFPNTLAPAPEVAPPTPAPPTPAPELAPAPRSTTKEWLTNLKEVEAYIDKNKKRPFNRDKDKNIRKYANWISRQQRRYQNKDKSILPSNIKKLWEDFINDDKYKEYFICRKEEWILQLELVVEYIVENKKRPSQTDKDKEIKKLSMWISEQKYNYKNRQGYVYDEINRHLWEDFINKYEDYL